MAKAKTELPTVHIRQLERGDVIEFTNPNTRAREKGIVYSRIENSKEKDKNGNPRITGIRIVPIETIGIAKKLFEHAGVTVDEHTDPAHVLPAGGTPGKQKAIISYNILELPNHPLVRGHNAEGMFTKIGTFHDTRALSGIYDRVLELFRAGKLYKNHKPVSETNTVRLTSRAELQNHRHEDITARRAAADAAANEQAAPTRLTEKFSESVLNMSLTRAAQGGYISERTYSFLVHQDLSKSGPVPTTLGEAYEIVTHSPERLSQLFGLANKGKMYQAIISEVTHAVEFLSRNEPA